MNKLRGQRKVLFFPPAEGCWGGTVITWGEADVQSTNNNLPHRIGTDTRLPTRTHGIAITGYNLICPTVSLISNRCNKLILSLFVANFFWIPSDEYDFRFQESKEGELELNSTFTRTHAMRVPTPGVIVKELPSQRNPSIVRCPSKKQTGVLQSANQARVPFSSPDGLGETLPQSRVDVDYGEPSGIIMSGWKSRGL
ncbi:hypothetical protein J6590_026004 [Homalodisca vitripennis]|nr:hypothetical protein J6590_026004 [Homalodisca vitripennis]